MLFILMGVSGSGKSTVGSAVAQRLGLRFVEGDDFHSRENVERMQAGVPLTDADRVPWITALAQAINASSEANSVLACSALTVSVRNQLVRDIDQPILFIHLAGRAVEIRERLERRTRHFMKSGMLDSQIVALQHPSDALVVDIGRPLAAIVDEVESLIASRLNGSRAS